MTMDSHLHRMAEDRCKRRHPDYHDSLICVGPGSTKGFGPPCSSCIEETRRELEQKRGKMWGVELTPEEAEETRRRIYDDDGA